MSRLEPAQPGRSKERQRPRPSGTGLQSRDTQRQISTWIQTTRISTCTGSGSTSFDSWECKNAARHPGDRVQRCSRLKVKSDLLETMNFEFPYYHSPPVDDSDLSLLRKENGRLPGWKAAGYQLPIPN